MRPGRAASWRRDLVAAALWAVAVIPAAMGFWLVAGSVVGVRPDQIDTLVMASLLALGIATLLQVAFGFRLPMYEGPAAAYLASITVIGAEGYHSLAAVTGGLLAAGVFVALLGAIGADRLMARAFTPLVGNVFVMTVTLAIAPATVATRDRPRASALPGRPGLGGDGSSWSAVALFLRRWQRLVPFSLLAALVAGTATYFGWRDGRTSTSVAAWSGRGCFPWGAPRDSFGVIGRFLCWALAAFNTIACREGARRWPARSRSPRRSANCSTCRRAQAIGCAALRHPRRGRLAA